MNDTPKGVVTIKKGDIILKVKNNDLIEVQETHDGIVFNMKMGLHLYLEDVDMPLATKQNIESAVRTFQDKQLTIDLLNYNKPTQAVL